MERIEGAQPYLHPFSFTSWPELTAKWFRQCASVYSKVLKYVMQLQVARLAHTMKSVVIRSKAALELGQVNLVFRLARSNITWSDPDSS